MFPQGDVTREPYCYWRKIYPHITQIKKRKWRAKSGELLHVLSA